jgi:predicted AlkP superfamily pyrophosphatase or phosphodiesterase
MFVLIDALGWKYVENTRFLNDLLPWRRPLKTILGFSSGAIPTILTGLRPAEHGHWNLYYYDPSGSPFRWLRHFAFLPNGILEHRVTRKILKEMGRRVLGMGPLFECHVSPRLLPWFNWVEKRNIYSNGGIPGTASIFDRLAESAYPHRVYSYHDGPDAELLRRARQDIAPSGANFFFLYLCEMDAFLHRHCQDPDKVRHKLEWYGAELRKLLETAREVDGEAALTVFSDHGMTPVRHHFDLAAQINSLGFSMPSDYLAVYDSTMARFWFFNERARRNILAALRSVHCGKTLSDNELAGLGILFPDHRYGESIFLLNPTWVIGQSDFNGKGWSPRGMHGYHPDDPHSDGAFLSNRSPAEAVREIRDVYTCMQEASV